MKTILLSALIIWLSVINCLKAQPVLTQAEKFTLGTAVNYFVIDTATVLTGDGGANVTWDFTQLTATGQTYTQQFLAPAQTEWPDTFPTSNLAKKGNDGTTYYVRDATDSVWLEGLWLNFTQIRMKFRKPQLMAVRPVHYNDSYLGTANYTYSYFGSAYRGGGAYTYTVDGWGTLKLQSGTYANVLRVKYQSEFYDTMVSNPTSITKTTTTGYNFYNPHNPAPIVQIYITSIESSTFNNVRKNMYVMKNPSTAAEQIANKDISISAWANRKTVFVKGFDEGEAITLALYDIAGRQITHKALSYENGTYSSPLNEPLDNGIYIVQVLGANGGKSIKISVH